MKHALLKAVVVLAVAATSTLPVNAKPSSRRELPPYDALQMPYDGRTLMSTATGLDERRIFIGQSANTNSLNTRMNNANSIRLEGRIADRIFAYESTRSTLELFRTVSKGLLANGYRQRFACAGKLCDSGPPASEFQFAQSIYPMKMYDTPFKPMINASTDVRYGVFQQPGETVTVFAARHADGDTRIHIASIKTGD